MITTFGWGGPPVLVLDENLGAAGAYSLRRLSGWYTGPAVRIRRSSDNAEQDIYFTDTFDFDTSAFSSFIGASTAFVKTWYDQSGNGMHVTQTSTTNQPQCNGTEIIFDGSTSYLRCSTWVGFTYTGDGNVYCVMSAADKNAGAANAIQTIFNQADNSGNNELVVSVTRALQSGLMGSMFGVGTNWFYGTSDHSLNIYYLLNWDWIDFSNFMTNGNTKIVWNNTENIPYNTLSSINPSALGTGRLELGKEASNFAPYHFNGKIKELLIYPLYNNNVVNNNIKNYYSIY